MSTHTCPLEFSVTVWALRFTVLLKVLFVKLRICALAGGGNKCSREHSTPGKPHRIVRTQFVLGKCPTSLWFQCFCLSQLCAGGKTMAFDTMTLQWNNRPLVPLEADWRTASIQNGEQWISNPSNSSVHRIGLMVGWRGRRISETKVWYKL